MSFSNYAENAILDHVFKGSAMTQPANLYVSLHSADPGETGTNELTGGGYARLLHNTWNAAASGVKTNDGVVTFAVATGNWVEATYLGVWDAISGGNLLGSGALTTPKTILDEDIGEFADTVLQITLD